MLKVPFSPRLHARLRAMTLVEIMVATLLTSLIMMMLWKLVGSGSQAAAYGTWYSSRIAELRTGLRMIREDLAKATYQSTITPTAVTVIENDATHHIGYKNTLPQIDLTGGTFNILEFHICKPDRTAVGGAAGVDITCTLQARGTSLHYTKAGAGALPEETFDKDIIRDVQWVKCELLEPNGPLNEGSLVITVRVRHPWQTEKGAEEKTLAKLAIQRKPL